VHARIDKGSMGMASVIASLDAAVEQYERRQTSAVTGAVSNSVGAAEIYRLVAALSKCVCRGMMSSMRDQVLPSDCSHLSQRALRHL
jgi:hypothetical protein